jgi:hypothetical protein
MNIGRQQLYRLILEEYAIEEGLNLEAMDQDKYEEFLAWINKTGPKPDWLEGYGKSKKGLPNAPEVPLADIHGAETQAFPPPDDIPSDDAPESEYSGFQDRSGPSDMSDEDLVVSISQMIKGRDAEHVSELFQAVFAQIPGVEIEDAEEDPETLYSPGAEGRPVAGFQLENLMELIREVIMEGHYHDMGGEEEMYNVLDPHGFDKMSDAELIDMAEGDGIEEILEFDGDGGLANRDEVIAALKDV